MTREEIKNIVRHVFHFYEANAENCNWTDMNEACGEIFKALEQQSKTWQCEETTKHCEFCTDLYKGDTLYQMTSWDGGIGYDYIYVNFCPICGRKLEEEGE